MWTAVDLKWLEEHYPSLSRKTPTTIEGGLTFSMLRADGQYTVNPTEEAIANSKPTDYLHIADTYSIRLTWPSKEEYPIAHEVGGRLAETARRLNKDLMDMHQYDHDAALCLASDMALEQAFRAGFRLDVLIEEFLIPYLFAQTHFAQTEQWLWGELSHGTPGILEWLARQDNPSTTDIESTRRSLIRRAGNETASMLLSKRWRAHFKCLCNSGLITRDCHPEAQKALRLLRNNLD